MTTSGELSVLLTREVRDGDVSPELLLRTSSTAKHTDDAEVPVWDLAWDIVDEWGAQSFPASDPPANW
jgi:hypothetical protein